MIECIECGHNFSVFGLTENEEILVCPVCSSIEWQLIETNNDTRQQKQA